MASYKMVIDLTHDAQAEQKKDGPGVRTPFADPDAGRADATVGALPDALQRGLTALGWPGLMPVQAQAIPYILERRDLVVQSRTGSGKTGAFLLPMLERLDPASRDCQALVLCPTRELARQIYDEFQRMNAGLERPLRAVPVYGGTAYGPQIEAFEKGAHVVIGTPGRVLDHLTRGALRLDALQMLVLDEADEMLSMGFYPDMLKLRRFLPKTRDGYMFSATMPYAVQRVGQQFLRNPVFLATQGGQIHVDRMSHRAYVVDQMAKDRALATLIEWENPTSAIVFANTKREVDYLATFLTNYGYDAAAISSDLTQKAREAVMGRLRRGELRFLVATDVAARGIDVADLSHVFQYDVPQDREYYVHRSGRTARAGKAGVSIALVTPGETRTLRDIVRRYDLPMEWPDLPAEAALASRVGQRLTHLLEAGLRGRTNLERERQARFLPVVRQLVEEGEPELLAMLLDRVYQASLHLPAEAPVAGDAAEAPADAWETAGEERGARGEERAEAPPAEDASPATAEADAPAEAPKPKRRTRARADDSAPASETAGDAGTPTDSPAAGDEATAKPKRRTRAKAATETPDDTPPAGDGAADEAPAKPKRRSRAKAAPTTETSDEAASDDATSDEAPKPKRRSRAKAATADAPADSPDA